jgi:DHA1 family multidrug resistance protein-like MFS transporter
VRRTVNETLGYGFRSFDKRGALAYALWHLHTPGCVGGASQNPVEEPGAIMAQWKRNLIVLSFAQLLTMMGFSGYFPSIPYYMQELGGLTIEQAARYTAVFQSGSALAMMIASPIWGGLSDRYGRKLMLVRATFFGAILAFLMSLVTSPEQLITIRILQGAFCGTVSAAMTLIATQTPEEHLGLALGSVQTVQFVGQAFGPLVGGVVTDQWGYRAIFPVSAGMIGIAFLTVVLLSTESFQRAPQRSQRSRLSLRDSGLMTLLTGNIITLLLVLGIMSFAMGTLSPILQALSPASSHISTLAGAMISAGALTSSVATLVIGRLGDKLGLKLVLIVCGVGVAFVYAPQAFVTTATQLLILRAVQGVFEGGMSPTSTALLAKSTPSAKRGVIFGISNSVRAGGRAIGPLLGAAVASAWGMPSVFLMTAGIYLLIAVAVAILVKSRASVEDASPVPSSPDLAKAPPSISSSC